MPWDYCVLPLYQSQLTCLVVLQGIAVWAWYIILYYIIFAESVVDNVMLWLSSPLIFLSTPPFIQLYKVSSYSGVSIKTQGWLSLVSLSRMCGSLLACAKRNLVQLSRNNEIMVAISNKYMANPDGALDIWSRNIRRITTPNHMVVALDDETEDFCKSAGINVIRMPVLVSTSLKYWGCYTMSS